jgi:hypothetical protein
MALPPQPMDEFRDQIRQHVRELEESDLEPYSNEWFFLRYLYRLRKTALANRSPRACSSIMKGLLRFFIDSIDERSSMAERFRDIHESYRHALRTDHLD